MRQKTSNSGYITSQLFEPPLRWENGKIAPGFLQDCESSDLRRWDCKFRKNLKFSDGSALSVQDFIEHLRKAVDPKAVSPLATDLFQIQGALEIFKGKSPPGSVFGVFPTKSGLAFHLIAPDAEFPLRLINPLLSPFKQGQGKEIIGTGAYKFNDWAAGEKIRLVPNPFYARGHKARPNLEIIFQGEDNVALKLYENQELSFLRRLPTLFIPKYKDNPEFKMIPQIRFDYLGYAKEFAKDPKTKNFREFLSSHLPYKDMQKLLASKVRPGCFGLPPAWTGGLVCFPDSVTEKPDASLLLPLNLSFSQNVDDNIRLFEWLQSFLMEKWNWKLTLNGLENKTFLEKIQERKLTFFRKGLAPDRPSCQAILENFLPGAAENYIDFENLEFQSIVEKMKSEQRRTTRVRHCRRALEILRQEQVLIPTGPIEFTILAKTQWTGWSLNEINGLDLSQLHLKTKTWTKE